jgi:hypothetical protein
MTIAIGLGALIAMLLVLYAIVAVETFVDLIAGAHPSHPRGLGTHHTLLYLLLVPLCPYCPRAPRRPFGG